MDFCNYILQELSYNNFTGGNKAQKCILLRLLPRSVLKDSIEICFIFF
jgi:hypothetical protein